MNQKLIKASILLVLCSKSAIGANTESLDDFLNYGLEAIKRNQIKIQELFYSKHSNTNYSPIKLEASVTEPLEMTLETILAEAIQNNINLNISKEESKIAKWRMWNKIADAIPDVLLSTRTQHRDGTFYLNSRFSNTIDESIVAANFRISYRAFNGGTTSFLAWAEKYYKESAESRERTQYNKVLLDSILNYFDLIEKTSAISSAMKSLESAQANYDLANKLFEAGTGTKYDVIQAEARLARAQRILIEQESNFRIAEINLAVLLNRPLNTPFIIPQASKIESLTIIDPKLTIEDFLAIAIKENPELKSADQNKSAIQKESLARLGDFLPKIDIYTDFTGTGGEYSDLNSITTLGFDANYNIGEGLGLNAYAAFMESRAKAHKAKLEYQNKLQSIEKNLRFCFLDFEKSKSLVEAAYKEFKASEEALRISKLRYENGIEIFATLTQKEKEFSEAELSLISSTAEYNRSQARLAYQMGSIKIK